jgi:hypothetical protein
MVILFYLSPSFTYLVNRQQFRMLTKEGARKGYPAVLSTWGGYLKFMPRILGYFSLLRGR